MSWVITVNNLDRDKSPEQVFTAETIIKFASQHPKYPADMEVALHAAFELGLASAVLSGGRTPNPYGGDEIVNIQIQGHMEATDYQGEIKRIIGFGPDDLALDHQREAVHIRGHGQPYTIPHRDGG